VLLVACVVAYTTFLIVQSRRETRAFRAQALALAADKRVIDTARVPPGAAPAAARRASVPLQVALIVVGLAALVFGARFLVDASVRVATALGVSELVIGLTIVSAGTSLPEVAASIIATARGHRDIAVGNVIGSNIFNSLCILGAAALARPLPVGAPAIAFDLPVMFAVSAACLPVFFTGGAVTRGNGLLFLAYYAAYTAYLILDAAKHDALPRFSRILFVYVVPITAAMLLALAVQEYRRRRRHRAGGSVAPGADDPTRTTFAAHEHK
jgi:cation:H+ antiporter